MIHITPGPARPLHGIAATRILEQARAAGLPPHTLMQRAGLAVARLALAVAPHARTIWVACGPGNNGGDGMEAAMHLKRWGKHVVVTWLGTAGETSGRVGTGGTGRSSGLGKSGTAPPDAARSHQRALDAGVLFADAPPAQFDLCIDALLGIGTRPVTGASSALREPEGRMAEWIALMNSGTAPVLAVDMPTGLHANTGHAASHFVKAQFTLSLLTLKPGLFTGQGRDASGQVWLDDLTDSADTNPDRVSKSAELQTPLPVALAVALLAGAPAQAPRAHASHKGSYGDVTVIGGASGMTGAALLAASAALHVGAGRVFVALLDDGAMAVNPARPELMFRNVDSLDFNATTLVCGCGGGDAIRHSLARVLASAAPVVLDADALNAIAEDVASTAPVSAPLGAASNATLSAPPYTTFTALLQARAARQAPTVLTPHPLEAARLLGITAVQVQQDRLAAARLLSDRFKCIVVLKGSGTVIATPDEPLVINPTGNAALATAGTGDVLAGMIGARLANSMREGKRNGAVAFQAACEAVFQHGQAADNWPAHRVLTAGALAAAVAAW